MIQDHAGVGEARNRKGETRRNVGLNHAGDDIDRRSLGGDHQVDTDRTGHLGDSGDRLFDITRCDHHEVGELIDDDKHERQALVLEWLAVLVDLTQSRLHGALVDGLVVARDVAEADLVEQVVAALHLSHRPGERIGGLARIGDGCGEQVRRLVVLAHLDSLRVDQDHADLLRRGAHQDRGEQRVETRRLARTGGAGNQDVGHRGQVDHDVLAVDVATDGHLERVGGLAGFS